MPAFKSTISGWFDRGSHKNATHLIVVADLFDGEDYPVFVSADQDVREVEKQYSVNMQRVMEVYNLSMDKETQLSQHRAFNY